MSKLKSLFGARSLRNARTYGYYVKPDELDVMYNMMCKVSHVKATCDYLTEQIKELGSDFLEGVGRISYLENVMIVKDFCQDLIHSDYIRVVARLRELSVGQVMKVFGNELPSVLFFGMSMIDQELYLQELPRGGIDHMFKLWERDAHYHESMFLKLTDKDVCSLLLFDKITSQPFNKCIESDIVSITTLLYDHKGLCNSAYYNFCNYNYILYKWLNHQLRDAPFTVDNLIKLLPPTCAAENKILQDMQAIADRHDMLDSYDGVNDRLESSDDEDESDDSETDFEEPDGDADTSGPNSVNVVDNDYRDIY